VGSVPGPSHAGAEAEKAVDEGALSAERWFCGPERNRRAYAIDDVTALHEDDLTVVRAERLPDPSDPDRYTGAVSLKLHTDRDAIDPVEIATRLERVAAIAHPGLGRPIESFVGPGLARDPEVADTADDVFYVAARWEDGRPLRATVPMTPEAALAVVRGIAGAVDELHRHGLTHRDLHPGNVIVRPDGSGVVIDFGTVRPDDGTVTATIAGVVGFIAPDTVTGGRGSDGDRWSVGMLAVHALLGHPQGSTPTSALRRELEAALAGCGDPRRAAGDILQMIDADPERRPPHLVEWVDQVERDLRRQPAHRRRALLTAVALVAIAVAVVVVVSSRRGDPAPSTPDSAGVAPAAVAPPAPVACLHGAVPDDIGAPDGACWAGPAQAFVDGSTRRIDDAGGRPIGVYVTAPDGRAVYLTRTMWMSYTEISGRRPVDSPAYGGYPVGVDDYTDPDAVAIRLNNGGLVIGPRADTQLFWVPAQGVERWMELGGLRGDLGFPSSNLRVSADRAVIEFQKGALSVTADRVTALYRGEDVPIDLVIPNDPTEGLDISAVRDRVIRQWGGTPWWVDDTGMRHWIPDAATFACLGGEAAIYPGAADLHGWTVWLFPLGAPATCAEAPATSGPSS
jgi:Protein kinase domain